MNPIIAIPARLASTRLPGKPLAEMLTAIVELLEELSDFL